MASSDVKNQVHLFRLQMLIIDGGLFVLRHILDQKLKVQNISFDVCLTQERTAITRLQGKIITQAQYDHLYPSGGQLPSTADLDITLIICLLRNLKTCGLNSKFKWQIQPHSNDTSIEADIYRLKQFRNEMAHINTTKGIDSAKFFSYWTDIEQILHRLNNSTLNPLQALQTIIDDIKAKSLDPEARERIDKAINDWQLFEKGLEVDMKSVKSDIAVLYKRTSSLKDKTGSTHRGSRSPAKKLKLHNEYQHKKKELKDDLITLYRQQYHTLPLSPLFEEHDTPLLDFYVMPDINKVEVHTSLGADKEYKSSLTTLREVFYKENKLCREIYIVADAGLGKTAFSKRLVLTWCQANKCIQDDTKRFKEPEIAAMAQFEFVFMLSLRDCSEECDIDKMIIQQIVPRLANKSEIIETVLSKEKCLVILDGLDEWIHPKSQCKLKPKTIPHRKARAECIILTTARPWKLDSINLKSSEMDQKLKLVGLNKKSRDRLKENVITILTGENDEQVLRKQIDDFSLAVADRGCSDLETSPLLLLYLLCLWCDDIDLGRSKCVIYCQIFEMLLKRMFQKHPTMTNQCPLFTSVIPQCFDAQTNCRENYTFLSSLGQLAFENLLSKTSNNILVFDRSLVEKYLNQASINLSLHSGIITQEKERKMTSEKQNSSFLHKTLQEFFAALYISTCSDQDKVLKEVLSSCNSVSDILEMSEVFIFISGINPELFSSVSEKLMKVINEDELTSTYRSLTLSDDEKYAKPVKEIQNVFISCMKEIPVNTAYKVCLQDVIFDKSCQHEKYYSNLQQLAVQNKSNIKSISIKIEGIRRLPEIITHCELSDSSIDCQKIYYEGECKEAELIHFLSRSVKCITIISRSWRDNKCIGKRSSLSPELSKILQNNNQLQAIYIQCFSISHDVLQKFLNYLVNRKSMKEIKLKILSCTDHGASCPGFNFDLSQHTELRCLGLDETPLSQLNVNVSLLEKCHVGRFSNPGIVKSYLGNISEASKLETFTCGPIQSSDDIQTMLQTLTTLVTVKRVRLYYMNLDESLLPHEIVNIEDIELYKVTLSSSSLKNLVSWIESIPQQVTVIMWNCIVTTAEESEEIKKYIKRSEKFVVVKDGTLKDGMYLFQFTSIK